MITQSYPKVKFTKEKKVFISFYSMGRRYRIFNGQLFNINIYPNDFPIHLREAKAQLLALKIFEIICNENISGYKTPSDIEYLRTALETKMKSSLSSQYKKNLVFVFNLISKKCKNEISKEDIKSIILSFEKGTTQKMVKNHISALIGSAIESGMKINPVKNINTNRQKAKIHKPIKNINALLEEIKNFNSNLYLCCLLTYSCLLRPHREVRGLKWSDFTDDLSYITLSGSRNKSGKNRIVPVQKYVRDILEKGAPNHNIFTGKPHSLNESYFKTIWGRFKKVSKLIEPDQTLYSFRHSGAIEIYKRTGSLTKLQRAMGHSSLAVSLTYLRGLEVSDLNGEDMPQLNL